MGNKAESTHNTKMNKTTNYSEIYKIMFDGYNQVGKSSIIKRYLEGKEYDLKNSTYIVHRYDIYNLGFTIEGKNIGVQLFDCKSNGNFGSAAPLISRRIDVFIFVYDITDKSTLISIKRNMPIFKDKFEEKDALVILVGNKADLPKREVFKNDAENLAKDFKMIFLETSTITGEGITHLFELVLNNITQRVLNQYYPNQGNQLTLSESMSQAPNPTGYNNQIGKPNNSCINEEKNNYEKLYNEERIKNENLEKEIIKLQNINEYLEKELKIEREKNFTTSKKNTSNEDPYKIIKLYEEISENLKEIKELKRKIEKYPFELCENEKLMSVIISTEDKNTQYSIICKNTDKFSRIEEKFYENFPEFGKTENSFNANGNKIKKYQTLDENGVKNGDLIIFKKVED